MPVCAAGDSLFGHLMRTLLFGVLSLGSLGVSLGCQSSSVSRQIAAASDQKFPIPKSSCPELVEVILRRFPPVPLKTISQADELDRLDKAIINEQLAGFAFTAAETNAAYKQVWNLYKNTPGREPRLFQLFGSNLYDASPELLAVPDLNKIYWEIGSPTIYEYKLLRIRTGDTVDFGGKRFRLGEFLGSGNSSHIYVNADNPDQVLKIGFLAGALVERVFEAQRSRAKTQPLAHISHARVLMKEFVGSIHGRPRGVGIVEIDDMYRFAVVERVFGTQTGAKYLEELAGWGPYKLKVLKAADFDRLIDAHPNNPKLVDLGRALIEAGFLDDPSLARKLGVKVNKNKLGSSAYLGYARQLMWDERANIWRLVDTI